MSWAEDCPVANTIVWDLTEPDLVRWLGYPRGRRLEGRMADRVDQARRWYAEEARPFMAIRSFEVESIEAHEIRLQNGTSLNSPSLAQRCRESHAHSLICVALSAGPEIDAEVEKLWALERPDEAFVLDRVGVVVTEYLRCFLRSRIHHHARSVGAVAGPASGPGYDGWPLEDQRVLFSLMGEREGSELPGPLQILPSGMLRPKLSMLLAYPLSGPSPWRMDVGPSCSVCNYVDCAYRRLPFTGGTEVPSGDFREEAR